MKFTLERAVLLSALGHVQSVVERRNTIPILSNVEVVAGEGVVRFAATDLDMAISEDRHASLLGTCIDGEDEHLPYYRWLPAPRPESHPQT